MNKKRKLTNQSINNTKKRMLDADTFQHMLGFLDVSTINEIRTTETYFNAQILKSKKLYQENYLKQVWGNHIIIDLLKLSTDNYKKDLKNFYKTFKHFNIKTLMKVLEMFYNSLKKNELKYSYTLFMFIYDNIYIITTKNHKVKTTVLYHKHLLKVQRDNELNTYSETDPNYKLITNVSRYLDAYNYLN